MRTTPEFRAFREDVIDAVLRTGKASAGKNPNELIVVVYGVTKYQHNIQRWCDGDDPRVWLMREPGNVYSRHAIAVESRYGKLGYLPDPVALVLAPHLDGGRLQLDVIYETTHEFEKDYDRMIGLKTDVRLEPWSDDLLEEPVG